MISLNALTEIPAYERKANSHVLSVYLNVDQSRAENLNRMYEAALKTMLREVETQLSVSDIDEFRQDVSFLFDFIKEYSPEERTLVAFVDVSQDFFWYRHLNLSLPSQVRWGTRPHIRRLFEAHDEYERYGVVVTNRSQAHVFKIFLNQIEDSQVLNATDEVKRFSSPAKDMLWSQSNLQRSAEANAKRHLKTVAELMDQFVDEDRIERLIIGGTTEAVSELERLLSERVQQRIIGSLSVAVGAAPKEVLAATMRVGAEFEREQESQLVERLLTASGKGQQAVTGVEDTTTATNEGRVMTLVYADGDELRGSECTRCGSILGKVADSCPFCGVQTFEVVDFLEVLVGRAVENGGRLECVGGEAADRLLAEAGGIGAFLRF